MLNLLEVGRKVCLFAIDSRFASARLHVYDSVTSCDVSNCVDEFESGVLSAALLPIRILFLMMDENSLLSS